jgi:hypothetical protein
MSSLPQKPLADPRKVKKLLEKYNPREAYEILAAQIILANERTQDPIPSSRVQKETRKIKITETDLHEIRTGRFGRVRLPSEEEARYWLQQWREGAKPKQETAIRKMVIRRNRNEARE